MGLGFGVALPIAAVNKGHRNGGIQGAGIDEGLKLVLQLAVGLVDVKVELFTAVGAVDGAVAPVGVVPSNFAG